MKYLALVIATGPILSTVLTIFGVISVNQSFIFCAACGVLLWLATILVARGGNRAPWTGIFPLGYVATLFLIGIVFRVAVENIQ